MTIPQHQHDRGVNDPQGNIEKMDPQGGSHGDAKLPGTVSLGTGPALVGGPATEAVPGTHRDDPVDVTGGKNQLAQSNPNPPDGGESVLKGQSRETGGERP